MVFCGLHVTPLTNVLHYRGRTVLIELVLRPDDPVASFIAPKWGLVTKGSRERCSVDYASSERCIVDCDSISIPDTDDGFDG